MIGESTELDAEDTLLAFGIAAAVATLLLLHIAFGSFRPALLTFVLLPMALVGGAIAVWMSGRVLSLDRWSASSQSSGSLHATGS